MLAEYGTLGFAPSGHPMGLLRPSLPAWIIPGDQLVRHDDRETVSVAGLVVARQRPGTAKGFIFISMEDETGIANIIVTPDLYERQRLVVTRSKFILAEGPLQNQEA